MSKLCGKFQRYLSLERGCGPVTIKDYTWIIGHLMRWAGERGQIISDMERQDWLAWRESLSHFGGATIRRFLVAAKIYCKFLIANQAIEKSTMPEFIIRLKAKDPIVPNAAQFLEMRERVKGFGPWKKGLLEIPAGTGLRIEAMLTLRTKHLHLDTDKPHILVDEDMACKGHRAGIVPMTPYVAGVFRELLQYRIGESDLVMPDSISQQKVRTTLRRLSPNGAGFTPHSLRHFYVCMMYWRNLLNQRFNVTWVRDAAGHGSITVTDRYLRAANMVCDSDELWEKWAYGAPAVAVISVDPKNVKEAKKAEKEKEN